MQGARPSHSLALWRRERNAADGPKPPPTPVGQSCWPTSGPAGAPGDWGPIASLLVVDDDQASPSSSRLALGPQAPGARPLGLVQSIPSVSAEVVVGR